MTRVALARLAKTKVGARLPTGWVLGELIGMGGTAAVYRGTHRDGRAGAVKMMHAHLAYDREWTKRLDREAAVLRTVEHPGLVRVLEVGTASDGVPYLVMELLEGRSLETISREHDGALPRDDALKYLEAVLDVLSHTHAHGIVHRDIKPSNVFQTSSGEIKVLDFGIASKPPLEEQDSTTHSATRGILGTPAFMAPEQARGRWDLVDERSDLWSVGALAFTLLSGQHVHVGVTANELLGLAMSRPARSVASVAPELGPALVRLIDRALAYEPEARWQSAAEFRRALQVAAADPQSGPSVADPNNPTVRDEVLPSALRARTRYLTLTIASIGVATLLGVVVWSATSERGVSPREAGRIEPQASQHTPPPLPGSSLTPPVETRASAILLPEIPAKVEPPARPSAASRRRPPPHAAPEKTSSESVFDQRVIGQPAPERTNNDDLLDRRE